MSIVKALTTDGGWALVELFGFVAVKGVVKAVIAAPDGTMQTLPLEELRVEADRPVRYPFNGSSLSSAGIVDARSRTARYSDL